MGSRTLWVSVFMPVLLGFAPAHAQSIQTISSGTVGKSSIITHSCTNCPPVAVKKQKLSYDVKLLPPGTQMVESVKVNGEEKIIRTEAWNGGSPVVFVSKAKPDNIASADADQPMPVDPNATTSVVSAAANITPGNTNMGPQYARPPEPLTPVTASAIDPNGFDLRLK